MWYRLASISHILLLTVKGSRFLIKNFLSNILVLGDQCSGTSVLLSRRWKNLPKVMASATRPRLWPTTDLRLTIIEEAMAVQRSKPVAANCNLEVEKTDNEELTEERAWEKCMFMNSLGLVRKDLVPTIRDVMDLRKRSRLRPRKPLPSPELPSKELKPPPTLGKPVHMDLHNKPVEVIGVDATSLKKKVTTKPKGVQRVVPQPVPIVNSTENPGVGKACNEALINGKAKGNCILMNSFGLVRTDHVPVVQDSAPLSRLRPRKPRIPSPGLPTKAKMPLPIENPISTGLIHKRSEEVIQDDAATLDKKITTKSKDVQRGVAQSNVRTRSRGVKRGMATPSAGVTSQSAKRSPSKRRAKATTGSVQGGLVHPEEPVSSTDPQVCNATPLNRAKRLRRRPSKLLDSDFVFDFLQPVGEATSGVTQFCVTFVHHVQCHQPDSE